MPPSLPYRWDQRPRCTVTCSALESPGMASESVEATGTGALSEIMGLFWLVIQIHRRYNHTLNSSGMGQNGNIVLEETDVPMYIFWIIFMHKGRNTLYWDQSSWISKGLPTTYFNLKGTDCPKLSSQMSSSPVSQVTLISSLRSTHLYW